MNTQVIAGRCLCGRVCYQVNGEPIWIGYCHCRSCQRATGAAAVTHVGVNDADLEFVKGERRTYESSPGVKRGFCADCGTPLTYESDRFSGYIQVYVGTFDEPHQFMPQAHVHYSERIVWYEVKDDLPRFSGSAAVESDSWRNR